VVQKKGEIMKISKVQAIVPAFVVTCALGLTASAALAKKDGKTKIREKTTVKENSGRQAGELPSGLQKYSEKNGQLPSGLQTMNDENGKLTKGLTTGGKKLTSDAKGKKPSK
jgi:X-X-X-Leu-X-X-Gly heptad repeat protein